MANFDARRAIESLRSGIPSREIASRYSYGRHTLLTEASNELAAIEKVEPTAQHFRVVCAEYGDGKSHALRAIWNLAEKRKWVVSIVSFSRETPLSKLAVVYRQLIENTYLPGAQQPGIHHLVDRIHPKSPAAGQLSLFTKQKLHPKLSLVIDNILYGQEVHLLHDFHSDLAGNFVKVSDLKNYSKQNNIETSKIPSFAEARDVFDYWRLIDYLSSVGEYRGWLILFDELELIGILGKKSRMTAYANLLKIANGALPHTYVVAALAQSFVNRILPLEKNVIEWLHSRGDYKLADEAHEALAILTSGVTVAHLPKLADNDYLDVMDQLLRDYEDGYGFKSTLSSAEIYKEVRRNINRQDLLVRSLIRGAVCWLDIEFQYRHGPTVFGVRPPEEHLPLESEEDDIDSHVPSIRTITGRRRNLLSGEME